ncbi:hypothetical protein FQN60_009638 [Etheostoma spectabile]|uniref:Uncharacterized protein n=1 Tax=Etheostoma spectabile TaxID=54343 RepID=A0A5J5DJR0_9PERO|nr:hypothetical protein FQN60_009638 [Etheostoma spectabile]
MSYSSWITKGKHVFCSDRPRRLYEQSETSFEGVNYAPVLHLVCGCTLLSREVHKMLYCVSEDQAWSMSGKQHHQTNSQMHHRAASDIAM